jgi:tripartite motif-containing protein 71
MKLGSIGGKARRAAAVFTFVWIFVAVSAIPVFAGDEESVPTYTPEGAGTLPVPEEAPSPSGLPSDALFSAELDRTYEAYKAELAEREAELRTPEMVAEREQSKRAYENLSPAEAEELIQQLFGDVLEDLNDDPARFLSDAEIEHVAEVDAATVTSEGESQLFEAGVPVRAEEEDGELGKVDVSLEKTAEGWEPANPLVDVKVGEQVEEGIEVGEEGVTVTQVGTGDSTAQPMGDKNLLFPEVEAGKDVDLMISPVAGGVEIFDLLRSLDSPELLRFQIEVPAGSQLRPLVGGGAEIVDAEGKPSTLIPAPWARDAQGTSVPVTTQVEGNELVLGVEHREEDFAYPILVDPTIYQNWGWWYSGQNHSGLSAWAWNQTAGNWWVNHGYTESMWPGYTGLAIASAPGNLPGGHWGQWSYSAPNAGTYLADATINPFFRHNRTCYAPNPYPEPHDYVGMWNETSYNRILYNNANSQGWSNLESWGRALIIGMGSGGGINIPCWRDLLVGGVGIWLDDWQYPYLDPVGVTPEGWVKKDATPRTFSVSASDVGLGVQNVRMFGVGTQDWFWNKAACAGTYEQRCPNNESGQITFTTNGFPYEGRYNGEGVERQFTVQVIDPTDKRWQLQRPIWLDGTAPTVSLNGQLATITEQKGSTEKSQTAGNDKLSLPTYKLQVTADDGADRSGVKELKVYLDKDPSKEPNAVPTEVKTVTCATAGCARTLTMDYTLRLPGLEGGKHSLWIVAVDKVGNASPLTRNIEFEYIPATGMKDEYVLHHFRLPDGNDYPGDADYRGPEIAVNVINGNVVFHQRDVEVDAERTNIELERVYNSQQPTGKDTQWGRGWEIAQAPSFQPEPVQSPPSTATMLRRGEVTSAVSIPQTTGQEQFSSRLRATVTKTASGYEVEPVEDEEVATFAQSGRIEEVVLGDDAPVYLEPRTEEELELMSPGAPAYASAFGSVGTGTGQFNHPAGAAVDSKGAVWVVDQGNDRVQKFNASGEFQSVFGSSGTGDGQFGRPTDVAVDAAGNLWVTDAGNNRVQKFNDKGEFLAKFGSLGSGNGQFNGAESIAIDRQGNIWVGDTYNGRLQKFNSAFGFIKVVGSKGSAQGQMIEPTGIDIGLNGDVWVADWGNNRVTVFNSNGEFVRQFGTIGSGDGQFANPDVIEVDSRGNVWVGDQNNNRIQQFNQSGKFIAKFGTNGSGQGQFSFGWPMGIASDAKGNLWISDTGNNRVQRWQVPGYVPTYASSFGSAGTGNGQLSHPADVAIDSEGNLWVPDKLNNRIQKFDAQGEFVAKYGSAGSAAGQLSGPSSIAFDSAGNFWVAERSNNRIQKFNSNGVSLKTVGSLGSGNGQLSGPEGIAIAPNGHIFVSDTYNHRIQEFNANGEFIKVVNPAGLGAIEPTGIAADANGDIWVTDWSNNRVVELNSTGALLRSFGTSGSGDGQFNRPDAVDVDGGGNVWVGDQNNGRIQIFNQNGEYVTQFGVKGSGEGQFSFNYPFGLAVTANGTAWIADANNNRIQRWKTLPIAPGSEEKVPAPYFDAPVVDYQYENGKLEAMQLKDEATEGADPVLDLNLTGAQVTEVESEEAGDTGYEYESTKLKAADGPEGETKYGYDASNRLTSVTLPNGTAATITYDTTSRATSVKVDPAGPEVAKTTSFFYQAEPRRTKVWGGGSAEITYDIAEDGSVLKWAWAETPPTIAAMSGSLISKKGQEIEKNKDHTLFITGNSPHGIGSIKVLANGSSVAAEERCEDNAVPPDHHCDQWTLPWVTTASDFPPGRLDLEVIVTDLLGHQSAERLHVIVPQPDPPDPEAVPRPDFDSIKLQREENGLDRGKSLSTFQLTELILEHLYEWESGEYAPVRAVEQFGFPMRAPELAEMEYRRAYLAQASEAIPEWAETYAPSTYGGYYVDDRAGGIIHVGFTGSPEQQAATVEALKASGVLMAPTRVAPMPAPPQHALVNVESLEQSVVGYIDGNASASSITASIGYSADTGKVLVESTNPPALTSILVGQFGASAPIEVTAYNSPVSWSYDRYNVDDVVHGGDYIQNENTGGSCTANYSGEAQVGVTRGKPDISYFKLSAGHCGNVNVRFWRKAGKAVSTAPSVSDPKWDPIGRVKRSGWQNSAGNGLFIDAIGIDTVHWKAQNSHVFTGNPNKLMQVFGMERMRLNRRYCWSGVNGGRECGKANRRVRTHFYDSPNKKFWAMWITGSNIQGDSGSPVWDEKTEQAVGILSGGAPGSKKKCVAKRKIPGSPNWCPVTIVTPLLPFHGESYPAGAMEALGVGFVRGL